MAIQSVLFAGLIGAFMLFCGDMTLYYSKNGYSDMVSVIDNMKAERPLRLYIGGLLGPVSAFVYCIGFYHIVLISQAGHAAAAWLCFAVNCLGIICGGAYHSLWPLLGTIGNTEHKDAMDALLKYMDVQKYFAFGIQGAGFIMLAVMVALGWTVLPRWMALFTPGILMLLTPLLSHLPTKAHMVICGGWTNLVSVIYYAAALALL